MVKPIQPVILRYHSRTFMDEPCVMLFIPDMEVNLGMIACYARIGQHSEASVAYYYETKAITHAPAALQKEGEALVEEYRAICARHGQRMKVVKRDSMVYTEKRYGRYRRDNA